MKIIKTANAGTFESNDIYVQVKPCDEIVIDLKSTVLEQFSEDIMSVIMDVINELEINQIHVIAEDKGAIDYTIRARVKTAILRGIQ